MIGAAPAPKSLSYRANPLAGEEKFQTKRHNFGDLSFTYAGHSSARWRALQE
jgi:hypothetical protein